MAKNSGNPEPTPRGLLGALTKVIPWLWGIDTLNEVMGEFRSKPAKETKIDDVVFAALKSGLLLLLSPFGLAFTIPTILAWRLHLGEPLKVGVFTEAILIVFVVYLAWKKLRRDPWSRAYTQAKLAYKAKPDLEPDALVDKVRKALGQDERAVRVADDAVRRVFREERPEWVKGKGRKLRLRIGRRRDEERPRGRQRSRFHRDQPLRSRLPRRIVSDLLPKRRSRGDGRWDFL